MEHSIYLEAAAALARQAGEIIRARFGGEFEKEYKSCPSDMVTEVDRKCEEIIIAGLQKVFPDHVIVGEESTDEARAYPDGFTWYVDPLDGTTNFVYGIPFCCVSIGLAFGGEIVAGVVYDPFRGECFSAAKGSGAFLNGRLVCVDPIRKKLKEGLLVTGYPSNKTFNKRLLRIDYHRVLESCTNLRALGAAALELAYIACGRLTGFWENVLRPWDVAAGSLLVEEAGGRVTDINGQKLNLEGYPSIVASNGLIHDELLEVLS
jgi:myo-inositol-1(or 4)-monophosphatase